MKLQGKLGSLISVEEGRVSNHGKGNYFITFPNNTCQFVDNKETESVERHNHLHFAEIWH